MLQNIVSKRMINARQICSTTSNLAARDSDGPKPSGKRGHELLWDSMSNKDLAFTLQERERLGLKGLLPPAVRSQSLQARVVMENFRALTQPLNKYMYLRDLQDWNKKLFYRILCDYTEEIMPIVYTPTVGEACQKYSLLYKRPRGLFLTIHDGGNVAHILENWPEKDVKAIVFTDGERILGLGDQGANGMGIPVGKLALYSALSGIDPALTLPVTLDCGTDNQTLLNDPYYIGLRQPRERGPQYDALVDEFMEAAAARFGRSCLIQFEDFGNSNAFRLLERYQNRYCTFNDDIQGTAAVAVAGVMASCRVTGKKMSDHTFNFLGAGEAAMGTAELLTNALELEGLTTEEACSHIWLFDSKGLLSKSRDDLDSHKAKFAKDVEHTDDFESVVEMSQASVIIGVSAQPAGRSAQRNRPFTWTEGRCFFASGSPFGPVTLDGKVFTPGQGNNAYIFPGVAIAAIFSGAQTIPNETFLVAAKALADQVTHENLNEGRLYPPLHKVRDVTLEIAATTSEWMYRTGLATHMPEPEDKLEYMKSKQYDFTYDLTYTK
ncbi:NADP-dependent malic enzyme [Halotydeus destructor]|nr:NADP-dependent malic enzyme [Halotydeus destructor]